MRRYLISDSKYGQYALFSYDGVTGPEVCEFAWSRFNKQGELHNDTELERRAHAAKLAFEAGAGDDPSKWPQDFGYVPGNHATNQGER